MLQLILHEKLLFLFPIILLQADLSTSQKSNKAKILSNLSVWGVKALFLDIVSLYSFNTLMAMFPLQHNSSLNGRRKAAFFMNFDY